MFEIGLQDTQKIKLIKVSFNGSQKKKIGDNRVISV